MTHITARYRCVSRHNRLLLYAASVTARTVAVCVCLMQVFNTEFRSKYSRVACIRSGGLDLKVRALRSKVGNLYFLDNNVRF